MKQNQTERSRECDRDMEWTARTNPETAGPVLGLGKLPVVQQRQHLILSHRMIDLLQSFEDLKRRCAYVD